MAKDVHLPLCTDIRDDLKQEHEPKRRLSGRVCGFDIILLILASLPKLCRTFLGSAFGESDPHKWLKVQFVNEKNRCQLDVIIFLYSPAFLNLTLDVDF